MMRLTEIGRTSGRVTIRVEGWITSADCEVLESECWLLLRGGQRVALECSRLTYVDRSGAATLRGLSRRNRLEIIGCPPFILEYMEDLRRRR
jgi:hypothetical protein